MPALQPGDLDRREEAALLLEWSRSLPAHKLPFAEWSARRYDQNAINRKEAKNGQFGIKR